MDVLDMVSAEVKDAADILALRSSLEQWLAVKNVTQWDPGEVSLRDIERQVLAGEWQLLRGEDRLRGALRLLWSDPDVWQHANAFAAYVHGLMVDRTEAGEGTGAALLRWAEQQGRAAGATVLRLDCVETNSALRAYYAAQGFAEVGRRDFDGPWHSAVLLEKPLA